MKPTSFVLVVLALRFCSVLNGARIVCDGSRSCTNTIITCPDTDTQCIIECVESSKCSNTEIQAVHDTLRNITIKSNPNANEAFRDAQINIQSLDLQFVSFEAIDSSTTYRAFRFANIHIRGDLSPSPRYM